eukprot:7726496-Ditylum_brightwellii.AAC.1
MGFCSIDLHPFFIVLSASSFTHSCTHLLQNAHQQIPPSTAPIWDPNPVFWTSKTQQNMPSLCQLSIWEI